MIRRHIPGHRPIQELVDLGVPLGTAGISFIGHHIALVAQTIPAIGRGIPLIGVAVPLVRQPVALVRAGRSVRR